MTDRLRASAQAALEALEIGYDAAKAEADQFHSAMAGYKQQRHAQMDADVQRIAGAITDLRAALAEPEVEQEPVAWMDDDGHLEWNRKSWMDDRYFPVYRRPPSDDVWFEDRNGACRKSPKDCQRFGANGVPEAVWVSGKRYTSGEWQGLTDEEIEAAWKSCDPKKLLPSFAAAIGAALKERNT